jgi:hypothetical protein
MGASEGNWTRVGVPRFAVDVFTDTPLRANQLAVFTDAREPPDDKSGARVPRSTSPKVQGVLATGGVPG